MKIVFISTNYPSANYPYKGTFVQQFVWAMARQMNDCTVVCPIAANSFVNCLINPFQLSREEYAGIGTKLYIYEPPFLSFSSKDLIITHTGRWTHRSFNLSTYLTIMAAQATPDIIYGHFLYSAGYAAVLMGRKFGCPAVIGVGESSQWTLEAYGVDIARNHFRENGYFLANSTPNRNMLVDVLGIQPERILMEPNGVDLSNMMPRNRDEMRRKHGLETSDYLVAFVGSNIERKGAKRLLEAIEELDGVSCILIGSGTETIRSNRVLRSGPVGHKIVPELLACSDIFVLPSNSEGSCNAVIEAMACGIPIITSIGKYMSDIVDDKVAILVNPMDVGQIRDAIKTSQKQPERRQRMSEECILKAKKHDINKRAKRVSLWMEELISRFHSNNY